MNVSKALKEIFKQDFSCFTENIYLKDSFGRTLSKPVAINKSIPEFDTSSMDGFAIKKSSLGKIKKFTVLGEIPAGAKSCYTIKPNECVKVYTGSRMPKNADFVVIQENTRSQGNIMYVNDYNKKSSYVRKTGLDFKKGQIISKPTLIDYKLISALASLNLEKVSVLKKPKVSIIPTGNEILALGSDAKKNSIYSSSPYGIKSLLENEGAEATISPICRDNLDDIICALKSTKQSQIIITLGGVSKGNYDLIRKHHSKLGIKILIDGISIRPGKPIIIGKIDKKIIFCLPGNPISSIGEIDIMSPNGVTMNRKALRTKAGVNNNTVEVSCLAIRLLIYFSPMKVCALCTVARRSSTSSKSVEQTNSKCCVQNNQTERDSENWCQS